ncbi:hypothetical protein VPH35_050695 [Triticum aestivum]
MATSNELSMKLLIEGKSQKVCFAEAGSEFVDTVTTLLTQDRMSGSIGNVLGSMEKLDASYKSNELPLSPAVAPATLSRLQQLLGVQLGNANSPTTTTTPTAGTDVCSKFFSAASDSVCPGCSRPMDTCKGHILVEAKEPAATMTPAQPTYTVGDDLSVAPASNVDLSTLQERTVKIGKEEALAILAASLTSKTVLTDVFLPKKNARCKREPPEEVIHI